MNFLIICGSLELGRDGVGDYSRRLATALIKRGYKICISSINDHYVKKSTEEDQFSENIVIPVLRLSSSENHSKRIKKLHNYIIAQDPEYISLQYVPFAFHNKGLPFILGKSLKSIMKGRKIHIMFHELWVGMDKEAPIKHKIWGALQKGIIYNTITNLKPEIIHTQSRLYLNQLKKLGFRSFLLPLFGNIPVIPTENKKLNNKIKIIVFGFIQPGAPFLEFLRDLKSHCKAGNKEAEFLFIGYPGGEVNIWKEACKSMDFNVEIIGKQSPEKISEYLSSGDMGISSTPYYQCEKSGTIAAMLEHNLQVYCVSRPWNPNYFNFKDAPKGIIEYIPGQTDFTKTDILSNSHNTLEKVSEIFLDSLKINNSENENIAITSYR